jgi:hypothetical protein
LHGSIDWVLEGDDPDDEFQGFRNHAPPGELPFARIRALGAGETVTPIPRPAVVFGQGGKLRSEGPFLELLLKFSSELQVAGTLLVVGYSFRDDHVNEIIARWFSGQDGPVEGRRIVVLDPGEAESTFATLVRRLQGKRRQRRERNAEGENIQIVEEEPGRVAVISRTAREGLADAVRLSRSPKPFPIPG